MDKDEEHPAVIGLRATIEVVTAHLSEDGRKKWTDGPGRTCCCQV